MNRAVEPFIISSYGVMVHVYVQQVMLQEECESEAVKNGFSISPQDINTGIKRPETYAYF